MLRALLLSMLIGGLGLAGYEVTRGKPGPKNSGLAGTNEGGTPIPPPPR